MQKSFTLILTAVLLGAANFLFAADQSEKIKELEQRIAKLEKAIEPILAQQKTKENIAKLQAQAQKRMRDDFKNYSRKQLQEIEALYQSRGNKWGSAQKTKNLQLIISKYPNANRAGCAMLYLGQVSKGQAREDYFKQAIEKYSDCFYGDGTQVGPCAKFYLAITYLKNGKKAQAAALFNEIKTKFPDAVDHHGRNLSSIIERIKLK